MSNRIPKDSENINLLENQSGVISKSKNDSDNHYKLSFQMKPFFKDSEDLIKNEFYKSVQNGDLNKLENLINTHRKLIKKNVNSFDTAGQSSLHYAVIGNHLQSVKLLVQEAGANVNLQNDDMMTPLHLAVKSNSSVKITKKLQKINTKKSENILTYLLSKGADPNIQDDNRMTPLHWAVKEGDSLTVSYLLENVGINLEVKDEKGKTALHLACENNMQEIGKMLLEKQSNLFAKDKNECNPFHLVCERGHEEFANLIINIAEKRNQVEELLKEPNKRLFTALHCSIENKNINIAKLCLEKGADVNKTVSNGQTALHMAASCGSVELVELLTTFGADMEVKDERDDTPLHNATSENHVGVIQCLINKGANIESKNGDLYTPVIVAAEYGSLESMKFLMENNCNMFAVGKLKVSVLQIAVRRQFLNIVKLILSKKVNTPLINIPNCNNNYPLHVACTKGFTEIAKTLLDEGAEDNIKNNKEQTPLHLAAKKGHSKIIEILCQRLDKFMINERDVKFDSPLHLAALKGFPQVVSILIDAGADNNSCNAKKWKAFHCAAANGHYKVIETFLEKKIDVSVVNEDKVTPLYLACEYGHHKCVQLLIKEGARILCHVYDGIHDGFAALDIAIEQGHKKCAQAILESEWKKALKNQSKSNKGIIETPMRKLIRLMPDVALEVLDKFKKTNDKTDDHEDLKITYNFEFIDDSYAIWNKRILENNPQLSDMPEHVIYDNSGKVLKKAQMYSDDMEKIIKNNPLTIMVKYQRGELLNHEVVNRLLKRKWYKVGIIPYFINLSVFVGFLISLLVYMGHTKPPYMYFNKSTPINLYLSRCEYVQSQSPGVKSSKSIHLCKYLVLILGSICVFKEVIQMIVNKLRYINIENFLELTLYVLAFLAVIDYSTCQKNTGIREDWQWQSGSIACTFAICNLIIFIRKLPFFGIQVTMLTNVMLTFIKFLPLLILFIFAYGFVFNILLSNQTIFSTLIYSLLKTTVMMMGEFDFDDTFDSKGEKSSSSALRIYYKEMTYTIFVLFIFMMNIITINLLIGLAVDDIKEVRKKANFERQSMKVKLALEIEGLLPKYISRRFILRNEILFPNRKTNYLQRFINNKKSKFEKYNKTEAEFNEISKKLELLNEKYDNILDILATLQQSYQNISKKENIVENTTN